LKQTMGIHMNNEQLAIACTLRRDIRDLESHLTHWGKLTVNTDEYDITHYIPESVLVRVNAEYKEIMEGKLKEMKKEFESL